MKNRSGRPPSACPLTLLIASIAVAVSGVPRAVAAQEIPVTLLEAGELKRAEVGPVPRERPRPPLEWRTIYRALTVVIPLEFECCRIPPQFTLSPREPYFARGNRFAGLNLHGNANAPGDHYQTGRVGSVEFQDTGYILLDGGVAEVELIALDPRSRYLVDFRVIGLNGGSWEAGRPGAYHSVSETDTGHILVVLETGNRGTTYVRLRGKGYVVDVTVSALGPIP